MNNTFKISHVLLLLITILLLLNCEDKPEPGKQFLEGEQIQGTEDFVPLHLFGETRKFDVSPDGKSMVYTGRVTISDDRRGLWVINLETGEKRRLLEDGLSADWSPDGKWIAFDKGWQIFKVRPDGSDLTQLTFKGANLNPDWSPDSQQLLYNNIDCGSQAEPTPPNSCGVLKMNSDGSNQNIIIESEFDATWISNESFFTNHGVVFDTGGNHIENYGFNLGYSNADVSRNFKRVIIANNEGIYYMNSDGTGYQKILPNKYKNKNGEIVLYTGSPTWCLDNKHIIYEHFRVTKTEHGEPDGGTLAEGYISFYKLNVDSALAVSNMENY